MENDYLCRLVFLPASVPGVSVMQKIRTGGSRIILRGQLQPMMPIEL